MTCLERNQLAIYYNKIGDIDKAIDLCEKNILEDFDGSFPYDFLINAYTKMNDFDSVKRVLTNAVWVFENIVNPRRADRKRKLDRYKNMLKNYQRGEKDEIF